ncbi:MAG: Crp/Fnr family transcriptional regulator [Clostridiales bacterium]|nr:Crp/Fnr family transcriptional regulator [Clostridiales bacterium]
MKKYLDGLAKTKMFSGISPPEIEEILGCSKAWVTEYAKNDLIIEEGVHIYNFGIILSGKAHSIKWDASGKTVIVAFLGKGSEIGVLLAANPEYEASVYIEAKSDVSVLFIPYRYLISYCPKACQKHEKLLRNYIHIVSEKALDLHERINCLMKPTLRSKIVTYLLRVSREQKSKSISIPFNRGSMAEYLNVDRSALSRELSKMKKEGLIDYHKNSFMIINLPAP